MPTKNEHSQSGVFVGEKVGRTGQAQTVDKVKKCHFLILEIKT